MDAGLVQTSEHDDENGLSCTLFAVALVLGLASSVLVNVY